jgi:hypothetical protein
MDLVVKRILHPLLNRNAKKTGFDATDWNTSKKIALSIGNAIINRSENILNQGDWHASFFVD